MEALQQLKAYYEQGYLSQEEYNKKRLEIIDAVQRGAKVRMRAARHPRAAHSTPA